MTRIAAAAGHQKNAQADRPRRQSAVVPGRRGGKFHPLLRDKQVGIKFNLPAQRVAFGRAQRLFRIGHAQVGAERRLDDQPVEIFDDVLPGRILAAPPGGHRRQFQFLAEQMPAQAGQKRHERRALQQAAAERVGHRHVARAQRLDQARHAEHRVVAQFQRVAKIVVHAAQDHIHAVEAAQGFQKDAVVAHGQVLALDEHVAEVAREIGLLEIGFVVRAGREHDDAGIVRLARRETRPACFAPRGKIRPAGGRGCRGTIPAGCAR